MNIQNHMHNATTCLKTSQAKIKARDYDTALAMLAKAYSNVRRLIEHVYELKHSAAAAARPGGG
ncbi:hypothetical protein ES703_39783 [subsurface metagenome]